MKLFKMPSNHLADLARASHLQLSFLLDKTRRCHDVFHQPVVLQLWNLRIDKWFAWLAFKPSLSPQCVDPIQKLRMRLGTTVGFLRRHFLIIDVDKRIQVLVKAGELRRVPSQRSLADYVD